MKPIESTGHKPTEQERAPSEMNLFRKAMALSRKANCAFGLEYFPDEPCWRATIAEKPAVNGCWWSTRQRYATRRKALLDAIAALHEAAEAAGGER